ncbi:hypothetical protein TrCOL_g10401 [Triparma columacea]|uniref:Transmembrane protein n=1 Tax=Triparma columacea TaxID=722753 RepID=A0A9W7GIC0_9STRA|nr:hypothetical protein TrCOL_g10401 [Triparma columacea]
MCIPMLIGGIIGYNKALTDDKSDFTSKSNNNNAANNNKTHTTGITKGRHPLYDKAPHPVKSALSASKDLNFSPPAVALRALGIASILSVGFTGFIVGGVMYYNGVTGVEDGVDLLRRWGDGTRGWIERKTGLVVRGERLKRDMEKVEGMTKEEEGEWIEGEIFGNPERVKFGEKE